MATSVNVHVTEPIVRVVAGVWHEEPLHPFVVSRRHPNVQAMIVLVDRTLVIMFVGDLDVIFVIHYWFLSFKVM